MASVKKIESVYSKKKGAYNKGFIVAKNITFQEAVEYVKKNYNITLSEEKRSATTKGFLFPGSIEIIGK